jgi:dipeptidyl aminopeptidase/acylaminoacyl peptidase
MVATLHANPERIMIRLSLAHLGIGLVMLTIARPVAAQAQTGVLTVADFLDQERVSDPQLSPDGATIVYTRQWVDKMKDRWESAVWIMDSDGGRNRFLLDGRSPRWSPDGSRLAFLARAESGTQIFVRWMDGEGSTTQVTRVEHTPSDIAWSPDGTHLAFQMRVPPERSVLSEWRVDLPKPKGAEWIPDPRIIESVVYRQDRVGYLDEGFEHAFVVPAEGGTARQVTSGDWNHGSPRWMADSETLVVSGLRVKDAEYRWQESEIYAVDIASGNVRQLTSRAGPDRDPVPSPDGKYIAYTGYDETTDDYVESTLYVMNADGSNPRALTARLDRTPRSLMWTRDGGRILFTAQSEGAQNLYVAQVNGGFQQLTQAAQMLDVTDVGANGIAVGTLSDPQRMGDVVSFTTAGDGAGPIRQLTEVNGDLLMGKSLASVEEIWYPSFDGQRIQGWIVKPPQFDPSRRYPMILSIHGGPHSMYHVGFNFGWQEHAANGYVVLYTNPRGSAGYGSAFGNAIQYNYPGDDFKDLMVGVDSVVGRGYVDDDHLFVYGCSGGGVLTSWTVGHTDRFAAAAVLCPVIDWISFVGNVDGNYLRWYADFAKFPWEDPSEHLRRSPLMYVGNVTTPTMLMTGVLDMRTPISQSEEFYQALKARQVPTALIRMNNEYHGTSSTPSNFIRTQLYLRKWFDRWSEPPTMSSPDGSR